MERVMQPSKLMWRVAEAFVLEPLFVCRLWLC